MNNSITNENPALRVVVADDEEMNLEILVKVMTDAGYKVSGFDDGDSAFKYIQDHQDSVDIVILDKMMPRMSGMDVLRKIKATTALKDIPIILQTGDVGLSQLKEGLEAGAYYYLSKPFAPDILIALVNAAARDCVYRHKMLKEVKEEQPVTNFLKSGIFEIKSIDDAYRVAAALACQAAKSEEVNFALSSLMINAIEHGNLSIGYEEKNNLLKHKTLNLEINRRLSLPENINKVVKIIFENSNNKFFVMIEDQGNGFEWKKYLNYDPVRLTDFNGRGIASANLMHLGIEYIGSGNKVRCSFDAA